MTKPKPKINIGERPIKALGRGPIVSPVILEEIRRLKKLGNELKAIGPINRNEKAKELRACMVANAIGAYKERLIADFAELGLTH